MAENEIIGRTSCPVCGETGQDVKINKNGNLYMNTDCSHSIRLTRAESRVWIPQLRAGKTVKMTNGNIIKPMNLREYGKDEEPRAETTTRTRGDTIRRADRTDTTVRADEPTTKRGFFATLLEDDDE